MRSWIGRSDPVHRMPKAPGAGQRPNRGARGIAVLFIAAAVICLPVIAPADSDPPVSTGGTTPAVPSGLGLGGFPVAVDVSSIAANATARQQSANPPAASVMATKNDELWSQFGKPVLQLGLTLATLAVVWSLCQRIPSVARALQRGQRWFDARMLGVRHVVTIEEIDPNSIWTPTTLHRRGWPPELMIQLLGPPDYAIVDPKGLREPLIVLCKKRVLELEASPRFRARFLAYSERQDSQARAEAGRISRWIALQRDLAAHHTEEPVHTMMEQRV